MKYRYNSRFCENKPGSGLSSLSWVTRPKLASDKQNCLFLNYKYQNAITSLWASVSFKLYNKAMVIGSLISCRNFGSFVGSGISFSTFTSKFDFSNFFLFSLYFFSINFLYLHSFLLSINSMHAQISNFPMDSLALSGSWILFYFFMFVYCFTYVHNLAISWLGTFSFFSVISLFN